MISHIIYENWCDNPWPSSSRDPDHVVLLSCGWLTLLAGSQVLSSFLLSIFTAIDCWFWETRHFEWGLKSASTHDFKCLLQFFCLLYVGNIIWSLFVWSIYQPHQSFISKMCDKSAGPAAVNPLSAVEGPAVCGEIKANGAFRARTTLHHDEISTRISPFRPSPLWTRTAIAGA